jgi:hypothetical protein
VDGGKLGPSGSRSARDLFALRKVSGVADAAEADQNRGVEQHQARAEFRRATRSDPWVLAGVWVEHVVFQPASPGVEPITQRLPDTGLLGWADLPTVIAPTLAAAAQAGLVIARQAWPERVSDEVPFATAS